MKERLAKAKKFIKDHEWETMTVVCLAGWGAALYLFNEERKVAAFYHNQMCDITEAAIRGYTMSYNAETERVHLSAPKV